MNKPYLTPFDTLVIPPDCDPRYRWWDGGQSIAETLAELRAPLRVRRAYDPNANRAVGVLGGAKELKAA